MQVPDYSAREVSPQADRAEIRAAFRRLARAYHPDLHPGDAAVRSRFLAIVRAHEVLSDPNRRAAYDAQRAGKQAAAEEPARRPSFEEWVARYHPSR